MLLIADLTQSRHIQVLGSDRLLDILADLGQIEAESLSSSVLRQVAARGGSSHILRGSYTKAGEQLRIDAILQEASTMETVGSERVEGTGEESFHDMVDELTRKIKAHFDLSDEEIAEDIDEDVAQITTSSPEALKHYIEGRKYHLASVYEKSIEEMQKAVEVDPEFAMAYRSMAMAYNNLGFIPQSNEMMKKALDLAERLPARERFFILADFLSRSEKTLNDSIEAYKDLLELYPDDASARHNLAVRYSSIGEYSKAIEHYEKFLDLWKDADPGFPEVEDARKRLAGLQSQ